LAKVKKGKIKIKHIAVRIKNNPLFALFSDSKALKK